MWRFLSLANGQSKASRELHSGSVGLLSSFSGVSGALPAPRHLFPLDSEGEAQAAGWKGERRARAPDQCVTAQEPPSISYPQTHSA